METEVRGRIVKNSPCFYIYVKHFFVTLRCNYNRKEL